MQDTHELATLLHDHTGTTDWYKHPLNATCTYTDGVRAFAKHAGGGGYWLLDILFTEPVILRAMRDEGFLVVHLDVNDDRSARLTARRDTCTPDLFSRRIDYTDCPPGLWRFYFTGNVLMLPREY
jgi:hypothetical protein